jgi:hypothetical protein
MTDLEGSTAHLRAPAAIEWLERNYPASASISV